jgi:hypothetical protein
MVDVPVRARGAVRVVEDDGDGRLGDAGLAALVDEVLLVLRAHLRAAESTRAVRRQEGAERQSEGSRRRKRGESTYVCHVREAEHETYRVENVALPRAVQARDRVEGRVPARDRRPHWVRLEPCARACLSANEEKRREARGVPSRTSSSMRIVWPSGAR